MQCFLLELYLKVFKVYNGATIQFILHELIHLTLKKIVFDIVIFLTENSMCLLSKVEKSGPRRHMRYRKKNRDKLKRTTAVPSDNSVSHCPFVLNKLGSSGEGTSVALMSTGSFSFSCALVLKNIQVLIKNYK